MSTMDLHVSPSEGSNGLVEKHCSRALALTPCGPGIDLEKAEGEISLELQDSAQEAVVSCANMAVLQHNTIDLKTDNVAVVTLTVTSKPLLMPTGAEQNCVPKGPEEERASVQMSSIPSGEKHTSGTIGPAAPQTELPNTVRPEPKVEVAADRIAVPFVESVRANIVKDGSPVAGEQTCRSSWQDALYPEPIMAVSSLGPCHVAMSPLSALGTVEPQENKALFMVAESGTDTDDFERLASDLIANIISAALAVACRDKAEGMGRPLEACSSIPVSNRQPCVVQEGMKNTGLMPVETLHLPCEEHYTASFAEAATSENTPMEAQPQEGATELNHCLPSPAWRVPEKDYSRKTVENGQKGDCPTHVQEVVPLCLANLQMEEPVAQVEDSGCRTCRLEDRFVSKEVLHSTGLACMVLDGKEDLTGLSGDCRWVSKRMDPRPALHEKTLTDSGLQNGSHMTKLIADQSSGFDVNGHHGLGGQATQPQTSKLVTLYVEIPKYLVGQLIGKQGKYIHFLKQSFGVKIHIFSLPYTQEFQICHIDGTQEQVDKVLTVISQKFTDLDLTKLYSPPTQPISLPSLPMTPWQQTPLTSDTLHSLNQQMSLCYSQPGAPGLTFPVKVGVICAAPASGGAWWRAQVIGHCEDSNEVEIQYLDYGGYNHAKFDTLRQIRSDFLKLPFQGTEVSLDHLAPLPGSNVNRMDSVDRNCKLKIGDRHHSLRGQATHPQTSELIIWEVNVPKHLVGRLIGKQGKYVRFLKQSFGVKIHIFSLPYTMKVQICHIEGTQQQVNKVLAVIAQKFKELDLTNLYTPPSPLPIILPSLPIMAWLMPPSNVTVDVIVVNILSARHIFVQQHTHPTNHVLRTLDQQMSLCYSQPGAPALAFPVEGLLCAAPAVDGAWRRARIYANYKDSNEVLIRYLDYGGYCRVMLNTLRQIRADFIALPFQGIEVLLDNVAPLPGTDGFSAEANAALEEITRGVTLLAQVTSYNNDTGLPLIQMWNMVGNELVSVNCTLVERGLATWVNGS